MPTIYNGGQSQLEHYAINGNASVNGGLGRPVLTNQTKIGTGKYAFAGPYKNSIITGNANDEYGVNNTNALADSATPYNGKGTGDGVVLGEFGAITNYLGGSTEDINGIDSLVGSGRNQQITLNQSIWGYGPIQLGGEDYTTPDTSANVGQVII